MLAGTLGMSLAPVVLGLTIVQSLVKTWSLNTALGLVEALVSLHRIWIIVVWGRSREFSGVSFPTHFSFLTVQ